jgi:hypothetical protein
MDGRVRSLYKRVLWAAKAYPGIGGLAEVRSRAKDMILKVPSGSSAEVIDKAIEKGARPL